MVSQAIVAEFCESGAIARSIETVKQALRERRDALCAALKSELPDARFTPPEGGYFLWVELPEGADVDALAAAAKDRGVIFVKGTDFLLEGGLNTLRLAYSGVNPEQIEEGIGRLADAYRSLSVAAWRASRPSQVGTRGSPPPSPSPEPRPSGARGSLIRVFTVRPSSLAVTRPPRPIV
jgi:alanine-alpha-ketoisovalerate/valine-pyruvate aminotransferase